MPGRIPGCKSRKNHLVPARSDNTASAVSSITYKSADFLRQLSVPLIPNTQVCPGFKHKDDAILFPCIGFCPGFEYKQSGEFRDLSAAKQPFRSYSGN